MRSVIAALLWIGASAWAVAWAGDDLDHPRGWFWYEDPEPSPDAKKPPSRKPLPPPPASAELMQMHPDDIKPLLEDYLKQAIWRPTAEHVRDYYRVQDAARRKSLAFASATSAVMLMNPDLDVARAYPVTQAGHSASVTARSRVIAKRLAAARDEWGLILFSSEHCPYCPAARGIVALFHDRHGWDVSEVDVDREPNLAARFGIDFTPRAILVKRGSDEWFPVQSGTDSLPALEENIYRALRLLAGEIEPAQFFTLKHEDGGVFDPLAVPRDSQSPL